MTAPTMHTSNVALGSARFGPTFAADRRALGAAVAGGIALVTGALLPWMTFYGGLQPITGTRGAYGKALLVAGIAACIVGVVRGAVDGRWPRLLLVLIGTGAIAGGALLFSRAWALTHSQGAMMLVPQMGPGLVVVMTGGALILLSAMLRARG